jgi:hypothetical protein
MTVTKNRVVSIWVGHATSADELENYLSFRFTEDGDAIPCPFGRAFGINWFDEDFREASVRETPCNSIEELLRQHSYGREIAAAVRLQVGEQLRLEANAVVMLFDFQYAGEVIDVNADGVTLRFLGVFQFEVSASA